MNVHVESGFILTLALEQDDYRSADQVLRHARHQRINLKIPAFSLSEPFSTVQHRGNSRNRLIDELRREARELGRTQAHAGIAKELDERTAQLSQVLQTQLDALQAVVLEVSRSCEILQLGAATFARAATYQTEHTLELPDANILASIVLDLETTGGSDQAIFISQNARDFRRTSVQGTLARLNCRYLSDFANAVRLVERAT